MEILIRIILFVETECSLILRNKSYHEKAANYKFN